MRRLLSSNPKISRNFTQLSVDSFLIPISSFQGLNGGFSPSLRTLSRPNIPQAKGEPDSRCYIWSGKS